MKINKEKVKRNLYIYLLNVSLVSSCILYGAMCGMERGGGSNFMDGLFTGFKALPSPDDIIIQGLQYFTDCNEKEHLEQRYKNLAKELHPDMGGNIDEFTEMKRQYDIQRSRFR